MSPERPVQFVELLLAGDLVADYLGAHAAHQVQADGPSRVTGRIELGADFGLDFGQAGLPEQPGDVASHLQLGPVHLEGGQRDLGQPVPGWQRRMTQQAGQIRFHRHHPAARTGEPHHLGHHLGRVGNVHEQRSGVHQVERGRGQFRSSRVARNDVNVREPARRYQGPGAVDQDGITIEPHDLPTRPHSLGQQVEDPPRAAAEVDRPLAWPQADVIEDGFRQAPEFQGLPAKPVRLRGVAAERVGVLRACLPSWGTVSRPRHDAYGTTDSLLAVSDGRAHCPG
jgi:hypothetical protein